MGRKNFFDITDKCGTCRERKLSVFQRGASAHIEHDHSLKSYLLPSKEMHLKYVCVVMYVLYALGFLFSRQQYHIFCMCLLVTMQMILSF